MLSAGSVLVSKNKSDDSFLAGRNHGADTGQPVLDPVIKMITQCMYAGHHEMHKSSSLR